MKYFAFHRMRKKRLNIFDNILKLGKQQQYGLFILTALKDISKESSIKKV